MLTKLIKYDITVGAKKYFFMLMVMVSFIFITLAARIFRLTFLYEFKYVIVVSAIMTIGYFILYMVISVVHLYSQLSGRESYFTYALPVSINSILLSKIIAILFWGIVAVASTFIFWRYILNSILLNQMGYDIAEMWRILLIELEAEGIGPEFFGYMAVGVAVSGLFRLVFLVFSVAVSNIPYFKNRDWGIAAGVITFVVGGQVISMIQLLVWFLTTWVTTGILNTSVNDLTTGILLNMTVTSIPLIIIFYIFAVRLIERHKAI